MEGFSFVLLILSLVENLLLLFLYYSLLSLKIDWKYLFFAIGGSLFILLVRTLPVSPIILVFFSCIYYIIILSCFYKESLSLSMLAVGLGHAIYLTLDNIFYSVIPNISGINMENIFLPINRIMFYLPIAIVMFLLGFFVRKNKWRIQSLFLVDINDQGMKKKLDVIYAVFGFVLFQSIFINSYITSERLFGIFKIPDFFKSPLYTIIVNIIFSLVLIWLIKRMLDNIRSLQQEAIEKLEKENKERMSWELKMQNHDNNHHLGMLYMLLSMKKYESARDYLKGIVDELDSIREQVETGNQALDALIYSKMASARKNNVKLQVKLINKLLKIPVSDWDLNRIVGNLLDNAIEAVSRLEMNEKIVEIRINGDKEKNRIEVISYGLLISAEVKKRIFERGFTSKKEVGHGIGLAICKELLDRYQGNIYIDKNEQEKTTSFIVELFVTEKEIS